MGCKDTETLRHGEKETTGNTSNGFQSSWSTECFVVILLLVIMSVVTPEGCLDLEERYISLTFSWWGEMKPRPST